MSRRPVLVALPLAAALAAAVALPAAAAPTHGPGPEEGPGTIPLVTGSMPEGISSGKNDTFYAGARSDGAVYIGNTRNGRIRTLVRGERGEVAVGLLHDESEKRLWVAGGTTGDVTAYHSRSGRELFTVNTGGGRFLNDIAITPDAVYVTDSRNAELIVIPTPDGELPQRRPSFRTVPLTGDYLQPTGFGANGIRALPSGDLLLVSGGVLYRVTPSGAADRVEVSGGELTAGDGLVLSGSTLYVVNGYGGDEVVVLRLSPDASSATITGVLSDPELDRPTTAALVDGDLYVVNGRFDTLRSDPDAPVYVTRLPL